jgi:prepilin-type N-terminal cleavage/methylation domain-containing protein
MSLSNNLAKVSYIETFCHGLTLVELLITISVVGVISAIAVPILKDILPIYRLNQVTHTLVLDLQYARTKAISQNKNIRVLFDIKNDSYQMQYKDHGVWKELSGESARNLSSAGVSLIAPDIIPVFSAQGSVTPTFTARIKNSRGKRVIKVSSCGRVRVIR